MKKAVIGIEPMPEARPVPVCSDARVRCIFNGVQSGALIIIKGCSTPLPCFRESTAVNCETKAGVEGTVTIRKCK